MLYLEDFILRGKIFKDIKRFREEGDEVSKPNVVIIMADQLRKDFTGGDYTPHINKLLKDSTVFERAYNTCPLCVPARGSFYTGCYPNTTGCLINPWNKLDYKHGLVRAHMPNLYTMMENEWDSWHTGKQHFYTEDDIEHGPDTKTKWNTLGKKYSSYLEAAGKRKPGGDAFKAIIPEMVSGRITRVKRYSIPTTGCYEEGLDYFFDGYITKCSLEAIKNRDKNKPFLLNAMFLAPHPPLDIPEPYYSKYESIELPKNVGIWSDKQSPLQLYNLPGILGTRYKREDWQRIWPVYAGLVSLLDNCIGQIISALKNEGMYDDTIIVFTADHGEMLGSHCLWQKMCMYEEATHVPLAIKLPKGMKHVDKTDELVSHIDVLPTLCDLLGMDIPENVQGVSLKKSIENGNSINRDHIFIQFDGNGARGNFQRCVVKGCYKLIVDIFRDEIYFELYNLSEDPQEMNNLAFDEPEIVRELDSLIRQYMKDTGDLIEYSENDYERFLKDYR